MKTTPCCQPPSTTEPFDGKPRVIVIENELYRNQLDWGMGGFFLGFLLGILLMVLFCGCSAQRDPFHAQTHYPAAYYRQIEAQDKAWADGLNSDL